MDHHFNFDFGSEFSHDAALFSPALSISAIMAGSPFRLVEESTMPDPKPAASAHAEKDIDFSFDDMGDSFYNKDMLNAPPQHQQYYVQVSAPVCNNKRGPDIARWTEEVLTFDLKGLRHYIDTHNLSAADVAELKAARRRQQNYINWKASAERKRAARLAQGEAGMAASPAQGKKGKTSARQAGTSELFAEVESLRAQLAHAHDQIAMLESMLTKTA